jgi:hypothetical protein
MFKNTKNEAFWQVFFGIFEWVVQQAQAFGSMAGDVVN